MTAIQEIEDWLRKTGMADSRLGQLATANQLAIARIRNGTARVATLDAVLNYIRANPIKKTAR